eukprot:gnl/TRDRNA2_/TRDRNA2_87535_c0_seq2.p1 gnl/TRDRNA2_/TRDRNA2_87535_c0~~gnl/TRDRNA2_/TRDRNA2_87535_c0_seq2.p1  ORF type:complete len:352 (-),score=25.28 gnl/TRDRNA2_/TRDRNA2_87535_c0_seq2:76-1131(-)
MRSIAAIVLLASVEWTDGQELAAKHVGAQDSKDKLIDRGIRMWPTNRGDVDKTMLGKSCALATVPRMRVSHHPVQPALLLSAKAQEAYPRSRLFASHSGKHPSPQGPSPSSSGRYPLPSDEALHSTSRRAFFLASLGGATALLPSPAVADTIPTPEDIRSGMLGDSVDEAYLAPERNLRKGIDFFRQPDFLAPTPGEKMMASKVHGTCLRPVEQSLRWNADIQTADQISCFNRNGAEYAGYFEQTSFLSSEKGSGDGASPPVTFYDSVTGKPLFIAPIGRSWNEFVRESKIHGWPSFRDQEVVKENVRVLKFGETVSVDGTHLGHNIPDSNGNRYCINLVSVAGRPEVPNN